MTNNIACPTCGLSDQVEKVSTIYITGLEKKWSSTNSRSSLQASVSHQDLPLLKEMPDSQRKALHRKLAPPSSGKQSLTRPINPDMIVIVFSLASPVFLIGMSNDQPAMLLPAMAVMGVFYAIYFWKRKSIIAKFKNQQAARHSSEERIKHGIERWMKLYYCLRDDGVFEPMGSDLIPIDQIPGYILRE